MFAARTAWTHFRGDVQGWLAAPATNQGWIIVTGVDAGGLTRRFDSRTAGGNGQPPRLFVRQMHGLLDPGLGCGDHRDRSALDRREAAIALWPDEAPALLPLARATARNSGHVRG